MYVRYSLEFQKNLEEQQKKQRMHNEALKLSQEDNIMAKMAILANLRIPYAKPADEDLEFFLRTRRGGGDDREEENQQQQEWALNSGLSY